MPKINKIKVGETEYDVQDKRVDGGVVPLLKALDEKEEAETGRPWFTKPQNAYARVYTESTATKEPYNKHFLTDRPVAPVNPIGRLAEYGKGVYFMKMDEVKGAAELVSGTDVKTSSSDSAHVNITRNEINGNEWLTIHKTDIGASDREVWIYPTTSDKSLGDGKKVIIEFDMKMESYDSLPGVAYDKGWTFKISPLFDGYRAITTSAASDSSLLIYVNSEGIRVRVNNVTEITYKHDPTDIFNFKLALFNKKFYLYINDYLMGVGNSALNTDTSSAFSRMGIFLNALDSVKFSIANLFCGIVEGEDELSGRYLGSIPVRRQNKHILVPGKLSDYVPDKLEGLDPSEYALSYGAAQEMMANAGGGSKMYRHSISMYFPLEATHWGTISFDILSSDSTPINTFDALYENADKLASATNITSQYLYTSEYPDGEFDNECTIDSISMKTYKEVYPSSTNAWCDYFVCITYHNNETNAKYEDMYWCGDGFSPDMSEETTVTCTVTEV